MMRKIIVGLVAITSSTPIAAADPCKPATDQLELQFQPEHSVAELADWLTANTCKPVQFAMNVPKHALKVTIFAPAKKTPKQAVALVVAAIEATGLRVKQGAAFDIALGPNLPKTCQDATLASAPVVTPGSPDHPLEQKLVAGIQRVDDTHYKVSAAVLDMLAADPSIGTGRLRMLPVITNGKHEGVKLYAIRPRSLATHLGFTNGDTIRTINGIAVGDQVGGTEILKQARKRNEITIELVRRSKPLTHVYVITR